MDFELNWGVHDVFTLEQYKENLHGAREAIPRILELFDRFDIHATWATVGLLLFNNKKELLSRLPALQPNYSNSNLSPYGKLEEIGENEAEDPIHYGHTIVQEILKYPNQEFATHTFSHYYCLEKGQTINEYSADIQAAIEVSKLTGRSVKSLVFPRNQLNNSYLQVTKKYGIQCYRGNEKSWLYKANQQASEKIFQRMLRLSDSYINLSGHHTYPIDKVITEPMVNLPSSRFLRPVNNRLNALEPLRLKRIKRSMTNAAKKGEIFHLWWHPHNFGKDIDENILFLTSILQLFTELKEQYGFVSLSMGEVSDRVLQLN